MGRGGGSDQAPFSEPQSLDLSSALFALSSPPGGPGPRTLSGVGIDDSCSKNSSLHLRDQPRRGNSLASGILLGAVGDGGALPDRQGGGGCAVTKLQMYLFPEVAVSPAGG